jgi:uncharacterized protein YgiM (DUF1202 family)
MGTGIMAFYRGLSKLLALLFLTAMGNSCAVLMPQPAPEVYYTIPSVTYFRDSPGYASASVTAVYRGEQVVLLSTVANGWCRVQTVQGHQVGWIQRPLLSPVPIPTKTYAVQAAELPLRDTPQKEGVSRQVLKRGDKVRKLSENQQGWWWVLVEKDDSLGWLPPAGVAEQAPETAPAGPAAGAAISPAASPPYAYVAVGSLDVHLLPLLSSQVVKVLKFNDKVERIAQSGSDWLKVRYPETGAEGWAQAPALTESPLPAPKVFPPKKKRPLTRPQFTPAETETPQPEEIEPEAM